jgi:ABC-type nitrate/sulfonate/bicarbonate transport system permease component
VNKGAASGIVWSALGVVLFAGIWQLAASEGWLGRSLPTIGDVGSAFTEYHETLERAAIATVQRAAIGYAIGVAVATVAAAIAVMVPWIELGLGRLAVIVNAVPVIALGPLIQTTALRPHVSVIFAALAVSFTTYVAVLNGLRSASLATHDVLTVHGATRAIRLTRLEAPSAVPSFLDALKVAAPAAMLGALLGEWYGVPRGFGVLMITAMQNFRIPLLWSAALLAVALSALAYALFGAVERLLGFRFGRVVETTSMIVAGGRTRSRRLLTSGFALFVAVAAVVVVWQVWIWIDDVPRIVAPSPGGVVRHLGGHAGDYVGEVVATILSAGLGLVIGLATGVGLAVIASMSRLARGLSAPLTLVLPTVPIVVVIPLVARIVGYNQRTVIVTAVLMAFFPIFVLVAAGLRARPPGADDLFATYRPSAGRRLWLLALPSAVPNLLVAVRIAAANCFLGALSAEWLVGTRGLGHTFSESRVRLQTEAAWAAILLAIVLSVVAYLGAGALEARIRPRFS